MTFDEITRLRERIASMKPEQILAAEAELAGVECQEGDGLRDELLGLRQALVFAHQHYRETLEIESVRNSTYTPIGICREADPGSFELQA